MARLRAHILDANYKTGLKYGLVEQNNVLVLRKQEKRLRNWTNI